MSLLQPPLLIIIVAFNHLCCATDDRIYRYSTSISLLLRPTMQKCVCVCVWRVANTTREAYNWECPPTTWQDRQRSSRVHCLRHSGYVHTLITALHAPGCRTTTWNDALFVILWPNFVDRVPHLSWSRCTEISCGFLYLPFHQRIKMQSVKMMKD